jgi:hypothetical protein
MAGGEVSHGLEPIGHARDEALFKVQLVRVLASSGDLNKLERLIASGHIMRDDIPVQIRGQELQAYLDGMVTKPAFKLQPGNLKLWTRSTCPIKVSSNPATTEQMTWAKGLLGQGLFWRTTARMLEIPSGSLQKLLKVA